MHKFVQRVLHCLIQRPLCNLCILHIVQFKFYFRFLQINWVDFIQGWLLLTFALNKLCIVNISGAPLLLILMMMMMVVMMMMMVIAIIIIIANIVQAEVEFCHHRAM